MTDQPSKEIARVGTYATTSLSERQRYALALSEAGDLVPKNFWTKPAPAPGGGLIPAHPNPGAILYMLEVAAMLGVNPMVGLTNIHIIEGKPSLSANLQAALVREAGHKMRITVQGEGENAVAIVQIIRSDDPDFTFEVRWGRAEATAAGVLNKDNWKKYYRAMLKARAITECIREACPEVLMGATYSPDELGAATDDQGEPVDLQQVPTHDSMSSGAPAGAPRPETPIVDTRPTDAAAAASDSDSPRDWGKAITDLTSKAEAQALYREARAGGLLETPVKIGRRKPRPLGEIITEVGQAFAEAEAASEQPEQQEDVVHAEVDGDEGAPAVLGDDDPNVQDAEIIG